ncbi:MAG: hypothetical protein LBT82_00620 [Oscillospiraceae bacterium]|nr:hypothetical protein [Oscillospiraceae bacterium]
MLKPISKCEIDIEKDDFGVLRLNFFDFELFINFTGLNFILNNMKNKFLKLYTIKFS